MLGYSAPELRRSGWREVIHPEDREPCQRRMETLQISVGGFLDGERRFLHRNGKVVWGRVRASLVRDAEGCPLYFLIHAEDVTERKRTEEALEESETRFRSMADSCPTMMWVSGARGENQFINRAYLEFCGVTDDQVTGHSWQSLIHPDDAPEYVAEFQRAVQEQTSFSSERRVWRADGEWRWMASYAAPRFSSTGEFLGHVGTLSRYHRAKTRRASPAEKRGEVPPVGGKHSRSVLDHASVRRQDALRQPGV